MLKKIKTFIMTAATIGALVAPVAATAAVSAQDQIGPALNCGANLDVSQTNCPPDTVGANQKINSILKTIINIFSLVVGVVAVIMIIIGGLRYITSGGESGNVSTAKNTIIYAIVGLVIVALAQFIVHFVLGKVAGNP